MKTLLSLFFFCSISFSQIWVLTPNGGKMLKIPSLYVIGDSMLVTATVDSAKWMPLWYQGKFQLRGSYIDSTNLDTVKANRSLISHTHPSSGGLPDYVSVKRIADTTNSVATPVNAGGMNFAITNGKRYKFNFMLIYSTAATTTGVKLTLTTPAVTTLSASVIIQGIAADAAAAAWHGTINSSGDVVVSPGVAVINVRYVAIIEGVFIPSASGTMWLQWSPEVAAEAKLYAGTMGEIYSY